MEASMLLSLSAGRLRGERSMKSDWDENIDLPRPDPDGTYDFQMISDWWTEMLQKCDIESRRIRMIKKDEGREDE